MSQYIRRVPARIRMRSKAFRCRSEKARAAEKRLLGMVDVSEVRVNTHASSITIHYDTAVLKQSDLFAALEQAGCLGATSRSDGNTRKVTAVFGKAFVGAVVQKAVEQSAPSLVGAFV